jgi:hypothetical protein
VTLFSFNLNCCFSIYFLGENRWMTHRLRQARSIIEIGEFQLSVYCRSANNNVVNSLMNGTNQILKHRTSWINYTFSKCPEAARSRS